MPTLPKKSSDLTVLLVDDHDLVRAGIKRILEDAVGIEVVGEAKDGKQALQLLRELTPDVVLLDLKMPDGDGIETTEKMLRILPTVKIVILTAFFEDPFPSRLLQAGAMGYITKDAGALEMIQAIKTVRYGQPYITPRVAQQLAFKHIREESSPIEALSKRELQVLIMIADGFKVQEIADKLCICPKTINTYRYRLQAKLGAENDVGLTHFAFQHGLVEPKVSNCLPLDDMDD